MVGPHRIVQRNGYRLEQPEPAEAVDVLLRLASSELSEADFVDWLRPGLIREDWAVGDFV